MEKLDDYFKKNRITHKIIAPTHLSKIEKSKELIIL